MHPDSAIADDRRSGRGSRSSRPAARGHRQIVGLDLLRFAAAVLVLLYHLAGTQWLIPSSEAYGLVGRPIPIPRMLPVAATGFVGVPVFFVISGFVIVLTATGATARRFLVNRALRLLPCAWICATVSFAVALGFAPEGGPELLGRYLRTLVLFPTLRWIDGAYWTLGIEISFYALVYALLALGRSERIEPTVTAVGVGSALVWCLSATPLWPGLDVLANTRVAKLALIAHGCDFALGVLIWAAAGTGWTWRRLGAGAVCLAGALVQIAYVGRFTREDLGPAASSLSALPPALIFLGALALFWLAVRYNDALARRLGRGVALARAVGLSTYPLYLLHTFVGALTMRGAHALGLAPGACLAAGIVVAVAAALAVSGLLEPPARSGLRQLLDRRAGGVPAVVRSGG